MPQYQPRIKHVSSLSLQNWRINLLNIHFHCHQSLNLVPHQVAFSIHMPPTYFKSLMFIITTFYSLYFLLQEVLLIFIILAFQMVRLQNCITNFLRDVSVVWVTIMKLKKFDQQNFNFPVDVLTENNEDKIGKACCCYFTTQRRYHTKSVFVLPKTKIICTVQLCLLWVVTKFEPSIGILIIVLLSIQTILKNKLKVSK